MRSSATPYDPIRFCVCTTVALLAWLLGPPVVVATMAALGLWAYARAMRAGLTTTRCVLRSPRLVLLYLGAALLLGVAGAARAAVHALAAATPSLSDTGTAAPSRRP